ncbi:unnamed protein product [Rotaria sp. Silwood2]|nr:unnamed protein product [Rotaria sp. Silwood2]CAF4159444.1 unnamed protein product [Rotaria sp. Silwood2]CAF4347001.1 unnamed protein product [Rotaria sp. Silwood2]
MSNNNVQLKLNDIWKNIQPPSVSSSPFSSSSLNFISQTTCKGDEQGVSCQGDVRGRGGEQATDSGELSKDNEQAKDGGELSKDNEQAKDGGELSKDDGKNEGLAQLGRSAQSQDDKQSKDLIEFKGDVQNEVLIQLESGEQTEDVRQHEGDIQLERSGSENEIEVLNCNEELYNNCSDNIHDHNYLSSTFKQKEKKRSSFFSQRRKKYSPEWEKKVEAQYKTYILDPYGMKQEKYLCWLYFNGTSMHCRLCEKYGKIKNLNGKDNIWCTNGMTTFSLHQIKRHKEESGVHKQAEEEELTVTGGKQPDWITTQKKILSKHEQAIENLMLSCIYLCQQDHPLNDIEPLSALLEKVGIMSLPAETTGVNYRNDTAALCFIQHIAACLHSELVEKIKKSLVIGWMMDETTSRSAEKSCIIYVRYTENFESKTSYYGLLELDGDGTANNIVQSLVHLWEQDGINPVNTCWIASDNASTFTGIHEGVIAKLKQLFSIEYIESSPCMAHSFALVGSQAAYTSKAQKGQKPTRAPCIEKLESTIGEIHNYFGRSAGRQFKLKTWQAFMEMPELKFKRIFDIRWSSIRGCIKPIIDNVQPGSQALLTCLQETTLDIKSSNADKQYAKKLLELILDDEFLFHLHMHHDLHESVLGPITKCMQHDQLSYFNLMNTIKEKRTILNHWRSESTLIMGPTLTDYIEATELGSFGGFKIKLGDRVMFFNDCHKHIQRLLQELDRRFKPSIVQEHLSMLFDVQHLIKNKNELDSIEYGRGSLDTLRKKYKNLPDFDYNLVRNEWESFKPILFDYIQNISYEVSEQQFWKNFITFKLSTNNSFIDEYKDILILLNVYLIYPTNSVECERGFSAMSRIQSIGRSRLSISTLQVLMTVRLLLKDDVRSVRCQQIVEKAFLSWNDKDHSRRLRQVQLLADVPVDYQPTKQARSVAKRNLSIMNLKEICKKSKKTKSRAIKCANGCHTNIAQDDPVQQDAIQCCHQADQFSWIEFEDGCSRWLCNGCRIKLNITTDSIWLCSDHIDMHIDSDENENEK